ncbi:MAG: hypothetical protein JRH20_17265 [Deltaproteobacteria bacterium]|nr:hypothetical protein [Deltaproteobacteria bacterium]
MSLVTLKDLCLHDFTLESMPLLAELRQLSFARKPEICIERARYVTEYLRDHDNAADLPSLRQAKKVAHFLRRKTPALHDDNLLPGGTTSKALGAPLFPEFFALTLWPELDTVSERTNNPQPLSPEDARELNLEIFPFWINRTVVEVARKKFGGFTGLRLFEDLAFFIAGKAGCVSHTVPTYVPALKHGLLGIIEQATGDEKKRRRAGHNEQADFYAAVRIALEGLLDYASRLAAHYDALALRGAPHEAAGLQEMAEVCRRVPAHPARTFREAVTTVWICQIGIHAENINMAMSPGRLDQILYPYFDHDRREGLINTEQALELIGCLWCKLADNVDMVPEASEQLFGGAGSVPAVTLGGVDSRGKDAVNDLTYLMLRATELLSIRDPNVNARYHEGENSRAYLERVSDVIVSTKAVPAIHNDVANIAVLESQGEERAHARDYAIIGCVELSSAGREYAASSSIILNLVAPLEMALFQGKRPITANEQIGPLTPKPALMSSFEQFWRAFTMQLTWLIEHAIDLNEKLGAVHQQMMPSPLLSAFIEGPMQSGKDLIEGGALYNSSGATHIGFADVVDSLNAIEALIFQRKTVSFEELLEGVRSNFADKEGERLRLRLTNKAPKYGTSHPVARKNARRLVDTLFEIYRNHINYRGGPYRPAYWTMTNHAGLGSVCGALPNGRKAGKVLASGITPVSGAAPELTECLSSVASLGGASIPGGWALNLKYSPEEDTSAMVTHFADHVQAYFREGGHQVQFNIMTHELLEDARKNPEDYPELMVRVSGYSAYFKDLNDLMKEELITRTEYNLRSGQAVPYER